VLTAGADGVPKVGLPCTRCDPWTVEKTYEFAAPVSQWVLQRVLAWNNVGGATQWELDQAVGLIDRRGSAAGFVEDLSARSQPLRHLQRTERLALEICVNHDAERQRLAGLVTDLEASWRCADELAEIIDSEF